MWMATIDFMKALDPIKHNSTRNALVTCGIEQKYISLFKSINRDQKASVLIVKESNMFEIKRRTKQTDPLGDYELDCLTNLRFADDVLLFATSMEQPQLMMNEFEQSTEKVGLKIHPEKTKILSNQSLSRRKEMVIDNIKVEMLTKEESTTYLGQMVTFQQQETIEIKNRIRAAWAAFYKHKHELISKSYFLHHRLRQFDMVIIPTMNYASGTWTLSKEHERMIQSTQRKMLRLIIQTKRKNKNKTHHKHGEKVKVGVRKPAKRERWRRRERKPRKLRRRNC